MPHTGTIMLWLEHLEKEGKSPHTTAAYRRALRHFIRWLHKNAGRDFIAADINSADILAWKTYQHTIEQSAPSTINQRLAALSCFYEWAQGQDLADSNPMLMVSSVPVKARQPHSLNKQDLQELLKTVHQYGDCRDIAIFEILAGTGIRVGELLALTVGDIDTRRQQWVLCISDEGGANCRRIPLSPPVSQALTAYLHKHPQGHNPAAPLWLSSRGALSHRSSVLRLIRRYTHLAGIDKQISAHTLRHTFAVHYLDTHQDDLKGLALLLGHSNLDTVMVYAG